MSRQLSEGEVLAAVSKSILEVLPDVAPEAIRPDRSLSELGANSVDRMEVVTLSMEALGVKIPLMSFAGVTNIGDLVAVLHDRLA